MFALAWPLFSRRSWMASLVLAAAGAWLLTLHHAYPPGVMSFVLCIYCFAIGSLFQQVHNWLRRADRMPTSRWIATGLEVLAIGVCLAWVYHPAHSFVLLPLVFGCVVLVLAFEGGLVSRILRLPPFLAIGTWSYSIYMTHILVLMIVFPVMLTLPAAMGLDLIAGDGDRWGAQAWQGDMGIAALLAIVVACSAATYRWIEQPGRAFGVRLARRWEAVEKSREKPAGAG